MSRVENDSSEPPSDPDPMKKPDPAHCDADKDETGIEKEELDGDEDLDFGQEDEIQDAFQPEPIEMVESPVDGLPIPVDERGSHELALAPPFSYENCVCIADDREYVEVFADELVPRGWTYKPAPTDGSPPGWCPPGCDAGHFWVGLRLKASLRWKSDGSPSERRSWPRDEVVFRYDHAFVESEAHFEGESRRRLIPVRPKRERCVHYRRQVFAKRGGPPLGEFGHYDLYRNCVARRSVGGAYLTIRDEAVYACEYRDPPDESTVAQHLDEHDEKRLRAGPAEEVPLFGIT